MFLFEYKMIKNREMDDKEIVWLPVSFLRIWMFRQKERQVKRKL